MSCSNLLLETSSLVGPCLLQPDEVEQPVFSWPLFESRNHTFKRKKTIPDDYSGRPLDTIFYR